ncbi:MAG: glycosyltransferase family 39 protein [Betaproteobacteria bacterium]|nr:MAG: glycosyltransferase family 39 protein [Betaproteobacteria bacterium]
MSRKRKAHKREAALKPRQPELLQRERREPLARALPRRWSSALASILIAVVTLAAFLPALQNQFVNWDDADNFLGNPHYRGLGWSQLRWMWTTFHMGHWIPLTWMTLGLDYLLWGMNPFGYHLTSLVLHAANAIVFYFVAFRILGLALPDAGDRGRAGLALSAGFAALLFALHPLRVESVAWATERRDVLSGLFYLLTILVYLRACERGERGRGWYWGAIGLFACALLSKSMAVSLPVVLLILDVLVERARASGLPGEDPVRAAGRWGLRHRIPHALVTPQHGGSRSTERTWQAGDLGVQLELLPLEDGPAPGPLAPLRTARRERVGAALPPGLRRGAGHHRPCAGPPPPSAGPPSGLARVRHHPAPGARDLSEWPPRCCRPLYIPGVPGLRALGRCRPANRFATAAGPVRRPCSCAPRGIGISHLESGPGLARLGEALEPCDWH